MPERRNVTDQSGFCRHSGQHQYCHSTWVTPSANVTCNCLCHAIEAGTVVVKKSKVLSKGSGKVLKKVSPNKVLTKGK